MRLLGAWVALAGAGAGVARVGVWPDSLAASPEAPVLAVATVAAYCCLAWLGLVLLVVTAGVRVALPGRTFVERLVGVAAVTAAAGVVAAGPAAVAAAADGGPFDRLAAPAPLTPAAGAAGSVVVARGDTLWDIAARSLGPAAEPAEVAAEWPRWYAANRAVVGPDPGHIRPGQRLVAPGTRR